LIPGVPSRLLCVLNMIYYIQHYLTACRLFQEG
jgi:hypothetical protein